MATSPRLPTTHTLPEMPASERPRERLARLGPSALSTAELIAILLRTGARGSTALDVGGALLARYGAEGLATASVDDLCRVSGCGPAKALGLQAAFELGRRVASGGLASSRRPSVRSPSDAAALVEGEMATLEQEHLRVVLLNVKHRVLGVHEVYKGSVSASLVRVCEVFREAVRRNCAAIVVVHNHPSGDPSPSSEDVRVTRELVAAGRLLDIEVLDHLVIGRGRWVSLRERGLGFG